MTRPELVARASLVAFELRRLLWPWPVLAVVTAAVWLALRDWGSAGGALAASWAGPFSTGPNPTELDARARAGVWGIGLACALPAWLAALGVAHGRSATVERSAFSAALSGASSRALTRWAARSASLAILLAPLAIAAEFAAQNAPARPLRAHLVHPGSTLLSANDRFELALPDLDEGELLVELVALPGTGPRAELRLELIRGGVVETRDTGFTGRRDFELGIPAGTGPLTLRITRDDDGPVIYLPRDSVDWLSEPAPGWRASFGLWLELLSAGALTAALWPVLRRVLNAALTLAAVSTLWIWAWLGGIHAEHLPGGVLLQQLDEVGAGLIPPTDPVRLGLGLTAALLLGGVQALWIRRRGEGVQT